MLHPRGMRGKEKRRKRDVLVQDERNVGSGCAAAGRGKRKPSVITGNGEMADWPDTCAQKRTARSTGGVSCVTDSIAFHAGRTPRMAPGL